jgi:hypothetical protein
MIIKLNNTIEENVQDLIMHIERLLLRKRLFSIASVINQKRISDKIIESRKKMNFDLKKHLLLQDPTGKTEGCGCGYCKLHKKFTDDRTMYLNIKRRANKLKNEGVNLNIEDDKSIRQFLSEVHDYTLPEVINSYKTKLSDLKQKYTRSENLKVQWIKALNIPTF